MLIDDEGRRLHERATRGETLAPAEQTDLQAWYARQDSEEAATLTRTASTTGPDTLREQVTAAARRLHVVSGRIELLTAENEGLRQEIAALQRQLTRPTVAPLP